MWFPEIKEWVVATLRYGFRHSVLVERRSFFGEELTVNYSNICHVNSFPSRSCLENNHENFQNLGSHARRMNLRKCFAGMRLRPHAQLRLGQKAGVELWSSTSYYLVNGARPERVSQRWSFRLQSKPLHALQWTD